MESIKKLNEMRKKVKEELDHIPRRDFSQNMLRQAYWSLRLHSIGKRAGKERSKEEVLVRAAQIVKKDNPNFCPRFNDGFFNANNLYKAAKDDSGVLACFRKKKE